MLAKNLVRAIVKRGGTAELTEREYAGGLEVNGELNGYDVHMYVSNGGDAKTGGNDYFTVRHISRRNHYDYGSDYNPGGWTFVNTLKSLDWATR